MRVKKIETGTFWRGFLAGLGPIVRKEVRVRSRGWRAPVVISLYLLGVSSAILFFYYEASRFLHYRGGIHPTFGLEMFSVMAVIQLVVICLVTPALASGAVSGEREKQTFDLLFSTPVSGLGVVLGKMLTSIGFALMLVLASLPFFGLVYAFGGVPLANFGLLVLVYVVTALALGATGLLFSVLFRRTQAAAVATYVFLLVVFFGSLIGTVLILEAPPPEGVYWRLPPAIAYLNPLFGIGSVLPERGVPFVGDLLHLGVRYIRRPAVPVTVPEPPGLPQPAPLAGTDIGAPQALPPPPPEIWDPWAYNALFYGIYIVAALVVASVMIMPVKPWQRWRANRVGGKRGTGK